MAFVPKVNQCGLFQNTQKPEKSDFNGQIEVECPKCHATSAFWINGWRKATKAGNKYLSIALKAKGGAAPERTADGAADNDGDIPF